ncbi:hypothetical protein RJ639_021639 [Escallonia herrerae]|uniref:Uncharacterized protein n=1 Tax=Escallonia herrerae TaxID=1293975 RepID=A0AA89AGT2_9ASTE|nr:hypothetical protein RJ639_021639 [Escallonia herrerae]
MARWLSSISLYPARRKAARSIRSPCFPTVVPKPDRFSPRCHHFLSEMGLSLNKSAGSPPAFTVKPMLPPPGKANNSLYVMFFFSILRNQVRNVTPYSDDDAMNKGQTTTQNFAELSESIASEEKKAKTMEVQIISKENIKPVSPTPLHLRTYKLSVLDQLWPHLYFPFVFFYSNNETATFNNVFPQRSQTLKQSLSETLTRFYPFAGMVTEDLHIECNDQGVYYVETRVSDNLSSFLAKPNDQWIHKLLPFDPNFMESLSETYVVMMQVNFFDCGGIAISICTSHKLIDGHTLVTFLKAWAATARGSSEEAKASSASSGFKNPSRVMAVTSIIWKCATEASRARYGSERSSVLSLLVNLRTRSLPPMPWQSIGNNIWIVVAQIIPNAELKLNSLAVHLRNAVSRISSDFLEKLKGGEGFLKITETVQDLGDVYSDPKADYFIVTSLCNAGLSEADFGWGGLVFWSGECKSRELDRPGHGHIRA